MTNDEHRRTLREPISAYVIDQLTVIIASPGLLRAREPVVHPTRVAVRRLRSTIRVFGELLDESSAGQLEVELVWFAGLLGVVRDLDILEKRLDEEVAALPSELVVGPVTSAVEREIGARRRAGWKEIETALDSDRFHALMGSLHRWRVDIPFAPAADRPTDALGKYVKRANKKVVKRLAAAQQAYAVGDPSADDLAHGARKAGKRHRYAAELVEPLWGKKATKVIARRKDLQDVLGNHQDAVVSEAFLRDFGIRVGARRDHNGFTYGILFAQERAELARLPEQLAPFFD